MPARQISRLYIACFFLLLSLVAAAGEAVPQPDEPPAFRLATTPAPQGDNGVPPEWWAERHAEKLALRDPGVELVMIGDSITHGWENEGRAAWDAHFADIHTLNLGYAADRTEHVLWRFEHGELEGLSPRLVVMMIGTNNTGHRMDPPAAIAAGVDAILSGLEARLPDAPVLLLAIFPRGAEPTDPMRLNNEETNRLLAALSEKRGVQFEDINDAFLAEDGTLPLDVMPDLLHPNETGYEIWAQQLAPWFERYLSTD